VPQADAKELRAEFVKRNSQKSESNSVRRPVLTKALAARGRRLNAPVCAQEADELTRLTKYVTELRKRHDEMFQLANRKETALQSRVDSVKVRACRARAAPRRRRSEGASPRVPRRILSSTR
jgi:hypothetical protein